MKIEIIDESMPSLAAYAAIPIAFQVDRVLDVMRSAEGFVAVERTIESTYVKDYDAIEHPREWSRFDTSKWILLAAHADHRRAGGAIVVLDGSGIELLEGRSDLAVLWDLRVAPECRGQGIGAVLFRAAEALAVARGCRELKVETQNVNVPACRFYQRHGCVLRAVNRFAYPALPDEIQLLWVKSLTTADR
jgi:GNAT superfamily N-acetyltransferase